MSGPCLCLSGKSFKDCCNIDIKIGLEFKESYPTQSNIILNDFYDINCSRFPVHLKSLVLQCISKSEYEIEYDFTFSLNG